MWKTSPMSVITRLPITLLSWKTSLLWEGHWVHTESNLLRPLDSLSPAPSESGLLGYKPPPGKGYIPLLPHSEGHTRAVTETPSG